MKSALLIRLTIYLVMTACIEASKEFHDVGAAKLHDYAALDWVILVVGIMAVALPNVLSFFDTSFGDYRVKKNETNYWQKQEPAK